MRIPAPGELFVNKYEIAAEIGQGGFAHVFRALDIEVGRDVAIKILSPTAGGYDPKMESRFLREARVIAGLHDPHTITMFEFGQSADGLLYMVFEYVQGTDLAGVLKREGALPPPVAEHILRQLLSALHEAHELNVLHRDIKPANVIVFTYIDDPWRVKLIDFGIAKPIMAMAGRDMTQLTRDGAVIGTPRYMAPEQFYGAELTARADLYSLGLVAFEMLQGRPAIQGQTSQELMFRAMSTEPIRVPPIPGGVGLCRVVERMLAREVDDRFPNAHAVVQALDVARRIGDESISTQSGRFDSAQSVPNRYATPNVRQTTQREAVHRNHTPQSWEGSSVSSSIVTDRGLGSLFIGGVLIAIVAGVGAALAVIHQDEPAPLPTARPHPLDGPPPRAEVSDAARPPVEAEDASGPAATDARSGCGQPVPWTGFRTNTIRFGFETRTYTVYVPRRYDPNVRHPVILMFHNAMRDGHQIILSTDYDQIAERENVVLVAPTSLEAARPWFGADDVALTMAAFEDANAALCLDRERVYALGHGGGGNFAIELRCQLPLSAVAATATGEYAHQEICRSDPTPMLRMYGVVDRHVPAEGGPGCYDKENFRSAEEIGRLWRTRNATTERGETWRSSKGSVCTLWTGSAPFVHCRLNGGHDWNTAPAKFDLPFCKSDPPDFPMGDTIWDFFSEHGRVLPVADAATSATTDSTDR